MPRSIGPMVRAAPRVLITTVLLPLLFVTGSCYYHPNLVEGFSLHPVILTRRTNSWIDKKSFSTSWMMNNINDNNNNNMVIAAKRSLLVVMGQRGKKVKKQIKRAKQEPTPPRIQTPYGPIRLSKPPTTCMDCAGRGLIRCNVCEGRGVIRATGHRKRNIVNLDRVIGSRWTSVDIREGHRHYVCSEVRGSKKDKRNVELRMSNSCGPEEDRVHVWISMDELRNKMVWRMGWVTLEEIRLADEGPLLDAKICFRCKGSRVLKCLECDGTGEVQSYEPLYD